MHGDSVISAIGHEGRWSDIQLLQQRLDMRGVIDILVGQIGRDDFTAVGIDAYMQFARQARRLVVPCFSNADSYRSRPS